VTAELFGPGVGVLEPKRQNYWVHRPTAADTHRHGPREPSFRVSSGQLGMFILFASLSILFAASVVGYAITRAQNNTWVAPGMPDLPKILWLSTAAIVALSATLEFALKSTLKNHLASASRALSGAWVLALLFVWCQISCWFYLGRAVPAHTTLYPFTFYFLTGLHAAHVFAGFVPLSIVGSKLKGGEYSSSRYAGLGYCVQYWHFLGVVWLILFVTLLVGT